MCHSCPRSHRDAVAAALVAASLLSLLVSSTAHAQIITGDRRDQIVTESGLLQDQALMPVGFSASTPAGGRNAVFLFALPTAAPGTTLLSADFSAFLSRKVNAAFGINYNVDLYALGIRNLSAFGPGVFSGDYFAGAVDSTDATLIQDNFAVRLPTDQTGYISTNAAGDSALTSYLFSQYSTGAVGANSYLALRLNPDSPTGASSFYEFLSGDTANPANQRPQLALSFGPTAAVPEMGTVVSLGAMLGMGALGIVRSRRRNKA